MIEAGQLSEGQREFLNLADRRGVGQNLFGSFVPEVRFQEERPDPSKPTIAYIHTGGTLAMVPSASGSEALSFEGAIDIRKTIEICDMVASIRRRYNIIGIYLANLDSKEVGPELWRSLAATIKTVYSDIEGVVVGHGTHTVEFSAPATSYALRDPAIPVVFAVSQIPLAGFPGSDGFGNLTGGMEIAANGKIAEVVAYAHGDIHRGSRFVKKNDNRLDVLESRVTGPIGRFTAKGVEVLPGARTRGMKRKHELIFQPEFDSRVSTLRMNPSEGEESIRALVGARGAVGLILETYGSAAIPNKLVPPLAEHLQRGFPIFLTSSCGESGVSAEMEEHDEDAENARKAGIVTARDMTTPAAAVKLMNVMAQFNHITDARERLAAIQKEMIERSYAGELTVPRAGSDF